MASESRVDLPTVLAMSVLAYTLGNLVHEGLGHGGMCVLVGAHPAVLNAIFFEYDDQTATVAQQKWISAGGSIMNVIVGLLLAWPLRRGKPASAPARYFLWLFCAVNLLTAFGYLLYSGIGGIGDWARVVDGLGSPLLWRGGMALVGAILYFVVAPRLLVPPLEPYLGRDRAVRSTRARLLCLYPYLAGGAAMVVAGLLNPYGLRVVLISAVAAAFGGTSLLAWYFGLPRTPAAAARETPLSIERRRLWIVAAIVVLLMFVVVLGPGVRLG